MDVIIYLSLSYVVMLLLFRTLTHYFFVLRLKKVNADDISELNIRHYPFVSTVSITNYIFLNKHLKFKDEKIVHLGNLLKRYYENAWVFSAIFPLSLIILLVTVYWLA